MFKRILVGLLLLITLVACGTKTPTWQEQYDLGMRYLSEGNYEEAIIAFTVAIEIDPKQAPAYVGRGDAYVLSDKTEENLATAQADYEKAIELDDTNAGAYLGLANVYIRWGSYDKALEILKKAFEKTDAEQDILDKITEIEALQNATSIQYPRLNATAKNITVLPDIDQISRGFDDAVIIEVEYSFDTSSIPSDLNERIHEATLISSYTFDYDIDQLSEEFTDSIKNNIENYQKEHSKRYDIDGKKYYSGERQYPSGKISLHTFSTNRVDKIWVLLAIDADGNVLGYSLLLLPEYGSFSEETWKSLYMLS